MAGLLALVAAAPFSLLREARAEIYGALNILSFDLENASISGDDLNDNGGSYWLHYEGRGRKGAIAGKDSNDNYLRLAVDPTLGSCNVKDRSEVLVAEDVPMDDSYRYLGFRLMIPAMQPQRHRSSAYLFLMQLWQSSPESPFLVIRMLKPELGSNLFHWNVGGNFGEGRSAPTLDTTVIDSRDNLRAPFDAIGSDLLPGVWHSFVFRFKIDVPSGDVVGGQPVPDYNNGNVKIWKDGVGVTNGSVSLPLGYWDPDDGNMDYNMKLGIYKDCRTQGGSEFDQNAYFEANFDEVRVGDTFGEAKPW